VSDKRLGRTKPAQQEEPVPRMPHERDESSDSQRSMEPSPLMRKAHDDIEAGRVDTDRGKPMDETYQRQKEAPVPARGRKT
jgi:hypothetical protein